MGYFALGSTIPRNAWGHSCDAAGTRASPDRAIHLATMGSGAQREAGSRCSVEGTGRCSVLKPIMGRRPTGGRRRCGRLIPAG